MVTGVVEANISVSVGLGNVLAGSTLGVFITLNGVGEATGV